MDPEKTANPSGDTGKEPEKANTVEPKAQPPEGFTSEEWDKAPDEWKDRLAKQSAAFQSKITEKHEQYYQAEKALVEKYPQRLQELVASDDQANIKLARRLAKEVYNKPLPDALGELKDALGGDVDDDAGHSFASAQTKHEQRVVTTKDQFVNTHEELKEEGVREAFEAKFKVLRGNDILLTDDEVQEIAEEAYLLAVKNRKDFTLEKTQKKIAQTAGGGVGRDPVVKESNPFATLPISR